MDDAALAFLVLDFAVIGALPVVFFRRGGRLTGRWWLTALPFFSCPLFVIAASAAGWRPAVPPLDVPAMAVCAASVALIGLAAASHRRTPPALWHQRDDAPRRLVTWGPYRRVRHPFYTAFLLAFLGALLVLPHPATLLALGYGAAALHTTAVGEERRLAAGEFGPQYVRYMSRTGRFLPRLTRG